MRYAKLVFALTLLTAVLAFVAGNTDPVTIRFMVWETPGVSLSLVAAAFFVLGILFTLTLSLLFRLKRGSAKKKQGRGDARKEAAPETAPPARSAAPQDETTIQTGKDQDAR